MHSDTDIVTDAHSGTSPRVTKEDWSEFSLSVFLFLTLIHSCEIYQAVVRVPPSQEPAAWNKKGWT